MMKFVNDCVVSNKKINLNEILKEIAAVENEIKN
jgi:7,8-dihydro-6-hydroxymethylpterin-pyrophosphokinase